MSNKTNAGKEKITKRLIEDLTDIASYSFRAKNLAKMKPRAEALDELADNLLEIDPKDSWAQKLKDLVNDGLHNLQEAARHSEEVLELETALDNELELSPAAKAEKESAADDEKFSAQNRLAFAETCYQEALDQANLIEAGGDKKRESESVFKDPAAAFAAVLAPTRRPREARLRLYGVDITVAAAPPGDSAELLITPEGRSEKTGFRHTATGAETRVFHNRTTGWGHWAQQSAADALKEIANLVNEKRGKRIETEYPVATPIQVRRQTPVREK